MTHDQPEQTSVEQREPTKVHEQVLAISPDKGFLELFVRNQKRLYHFLLAQTGNAAIAEEVLQNSNVVILSKWQQFQTGTNFLAWIYRIASLEFLKYRQTQRRSKLYFDDDFIHQVTEAVEQLQSQHEERQQALDLCLEKLRSKDREMIRLRYQLGNDGKALSERLERPLNSIYQSLGRIRRTLLECVEREMAAMQR